MPSVWFALKRSLTCKTQPSDVHDPKKIVRRTTRRTNSDCCSRSISNVNVNKVVNRNWSKRNIRKPQEHVGSDEPISPIVHEVVRKNQTYELKIRNGSGRSIGTLVPGTPGPGEHMSLSGSSRSRSVNKSLGKSDSFRKIILSSGFSAVHRKRRVGLKSQSSIDVSAFPCRKCGEEFFKLQDVEAHHLSKHAGNVENVELFFFLSLFMLLESV